MWKSLRKNWLFWACITVLAALFPIMAWVPSPFTIGVALTDFLAAVVLLCAWLEKQGAGW